MELAHTIVNALEDKKGEDIILLDIKGIVSFTDYFILEHKMKGRIVGTPDSGWMIIDFGDIIIHLFDADLRRYYKLEELWDEGKILLRLQ
jgi:ribosome-associated protein